MSKKYITTQRIYKSVGGDLSLEAEGSLAYSVGKLVSDVDDQKAIDALVNKDAGAAPENKDAGAAPENKAAKQSRRKRSKK